MTAKALVGKDGLAETVPPWAVLNSPARGMRATAQATSARIYARAPPVILAPAIL
ncbi:hypothetical protein GCM10010347_39580 [Streptomyces cirratus]|uniref:Uncharacterized protein n=1 Tax=Streptomyces cirratus TaxID=68187 RepID=A0ABQ3F026_9ACTN|nr:hypothetical protein GCM10010347_39580 [Streptomyces cirratus]